MWTTKARKKRLDLLHLEEYEVLTEELPCVCKVYLPQNSTYRKEQGLIHVCSKSLIFESDSENIPMFKYLYRFCTEIPAVEGDDVVFNVKNMVEIRTNGPPSPYIKHYLKEPVEIRLTPKYAEDATRIVTWINTIYEIDKEASVSGKDPVLEITKLIMSRQNSFEFDRRNLQSVNERDIIKQQLFVQRILPLRSAYGFIHLTNKNFYFQLLQSDGKTPVLRIRLKKVTRIFKRRFALQDKAIEFMTAKDESYYFVFNTVQLRDAVYTKMRENAPDCVSEEAISKMTYLWQKRKISNYEYLIRLNEAAQRSFSDLSQYPVFPWVITDFESETINLANSAHYRDLSKPIGALNPYRFEQFMKRYKDMPEPKFMYGTHYSTPGYVIGYLVRSHPLYMLKIQSGRYDKPDRLFYSIKNDWKNCYENPAIVKELIPEFYGRDDNFLVNRLDLDLGTRQNGKVVNDVKLPKWAKNAKTFLKINRQALESDYVSKNLHKWIDLIFGYKQRGEESVKAQNVFNYMTYEGQVNIHTIENLVERRAVIVQINEYGQTPKQLFKLPHPSRDGSQESIETTKQDLELIQENKMIEKKRKENEIKKTQRMEEIQNSQGGPGGLGMSPTQANAATLRERVNFTVKAKKSKKVHKNDVTSVKYLDSSKAVLSTGKDGFIKMSDFSTLELKKSFRISDMPLSCFAEIGKELYVVGGWNSCLHLFNMNYGSSLQVFEAHDDAVSNILYIPSKEVLVTTSWDCTIRFWMVQGEMIDETYVAIIDDLESQCTALDISQDSQMLAYGDELGFLYIYSLESFSVVASIRSLGYQILDICMDKSYSLIVAYSNTISVYDKSGNPVRVFTVKEEYGRVVKMKARQNIVVACTEKANFLLVDIMAEDILAEVSCDNVDKVGSGFINIEFDTEFVRGCSGNHNGEIVVYDVM